MVFVTLIENLLMPMNIDLILMNKISLLVIEKSLFLYFISSIQIKTFFFENFSLSILIETYNVRTFSKKVPRPMFYGEPIKKFHNSFDFWLKYYFRKNSPTPFLASFI